MGNQYEHISAYVKSIRVPHIVTSTVRTAGSKTSAGHLSCHAEDNVRCDAIDIRGPNRTIEELKTIFWSFEPVFHLLHELILSAPGITFNIKDGKKVPPYATSSHKDHVHVSVLRTKAPLPIGGGDEDMIYRINYLGTVYEFTDVLVHEPTGGLWALRADGGIFTLPPKPDQPAGPDNPMPPFYEAYDKGDDEGWRATKIMPYKGGYMFVNDRGQPYHFPAK